MMHLWAFDFDGTVSALSVDARRAGYHPACRSLLEHLIGRGDPCAILSSRRLEDLVAVADLPGLYLGGGSGVEWRRPDGSRHAAAADREGELQANRDRVMADIVEWGRLDGVRIEDKRWSVAVHLRGAAAPVRTAAAQRVAQWRRASGLPVFQGPEVFEIQLLAGVDKAFGLRRLVELTGFDPAVGRVLYAGDDENDARAMALALAWGGRAIAVGPRADCAGADTAAGPAELAQTVRRLLAADG